MKTQTVINGLREKGYKVSIAHYRQTAVGELSMRAIHQAKANGGPYPQPLTKGGRVEAKIRATDDALLAMGESICSPLDNFNRKNGTRIALGRAVKNLDSRPRLTNGVF